MDVFEKARLACRLTADDPSEDADCDGSASWWASTRERPESLEAAETEMHELWRTLCAVQDVFDWMRERHDYLESTIIPGMRRVRQLETQRKGMSAEERRRHEEDLDRFKREILGLKPGDPGYGYDR